MSNINKSPILIFGASGAIGSSAAHILKKINTNYYYQIVITTKISKV